MDLETLKIKPFKITVLFGGKRSTLKVEQSYLSESRETFSVVDDTQTFRIISNRPEIKAVPKSRKKPTYKALDGRIEQMSFFESIVTEIQSHLKRLENTSF